MNLRVATTIILAFSFLLSKSAYSEESDSIANEIFALIYNEQYAEAKKALVDMAASVDPFYVDILKTDLYWWEYVQNKKIDNSRRLKAMLTELKNSDSTLIEGKIRQLIGSSYQIRYEFKRFNIIGAMLLKPKIKKLLEELKSEKLEYNDNRLELLYLYDALFQYLDNFVNPFFAERKYADKENALTKLDKFVFNDDLIVKTFATYFSGKIYLNIEKKPEKGIVCFRQLNILFPDNRVFIQLLAECEKRINSTTVDDVD